MMAHDANNLSINPFLFIVPMPDRGYSKSSRLGDTEKWNAELIDENKSLKLRLDNPFADLPEDKKARAKALDAIVERGARGYIDLARALSEIKQSELFRELGFDKWEDYCIEKRNIAKSYAYKLLEAFEICTIVQNKGLPPPVTESHARELRPLLEDESKLLEAYEMFLELDASTRTANALRGIVAGYLPSRGENAVPAASEPSPAAQTAGPTIDDSSVGESGRESGVQDVVTARASYGPPGNLASLPLPMEREGQEVQRGVPDARLPAAASPAPPSARALGPTPSVGESAAAPHLVVHLSLDAAIEAAFAKADAGDDKIIEDLKWAAYTISRKLKALGYEPFDWMKDEPT